MAESTSTTKPAAATPKANPKSAKPPTAPSRRHAVASAEQAGRREPRDHPRGRKRKPRVSRTVTPQVRRARRGSRWRS